LKKKYGTQAALVSAWKAYQQELGEEMLQNGDFSQGLAPWELEVNSPAEASVQVTQEGPAGAPAARIEVKETSSVGWYVQISQSQLQAQTDKPYTLVFYAKAEPARDITVGMFMSHEPWQNLGFYKQVDISAGWQKFEWTFVHSMSDSNARAVFTDMAKTKDCDRG
jgi:hypothetical protein